MNLNTSWLEKHTILRELNNDERDALGCLTIQEYKQYETIIEKGQQGGMLYILHSGIAQVEDVNEGVRIRIAGVEEGAIFGVISFLGEQTAVVDVLAMEDCVVYKLSKDDFSILMQNQQELAYAILSQILKSQSEIIRRMNGELLPIWRNLKKKAMQLPFIVKFIPVLFVLAYIAAFAYVSTTHEAIPLLP